MISPQDALARLKEGNRRFVNADDSYESYEHQARRDQLLDGQNPFAIVLGCSDSRVPTEIIFDQGLGDLFVIRVAGNVVAPSQVGSVEFAAAYLGAKLVVVLGHSGCGAVAATLAEIARPTEAQSPNLRGIVERIRPAVESLLNGELEPGPALLNKAVRANVRASVEQLRRGSAILEELIRSDGLLVVGAEYSLESGRVDFLDEVADAGGAQGEDGARRRPLA